MVVTDDRYLLFYSANAWDSADYAIGWADCRSPTGPCERVDDGPGMDSTTFAHGPGGQEFLQALGDVWMVTTGGPTTKQGRRAANGACMWTCSISTA